MKVTTILSAFSAAALVSAGKYHASPDSVKIVPGGFILEYNEEIQHQNAYVSLKAHSVDYEVRNAYSIFHGAAINVNSDHDGNALASLPGIKNVWPITLHSIPKTRASTKNATDPEVVSLHHMTGVDIVHEKLKLTGKGVKVGVIDTGVDYLHPAFAAKGADAGCFGNKGKNCRVAYGWDFVGDDYTGSNKPVPDADPRDCQGHGSHVAGIIGANALDIKTTPKPPQPFVGVAPEVTIGAYRIFGCEGQSGDDVIMAAMERAFHDGMDIINMSLGGGSAYKSNPQAVLGDKLVANGMALAAAAGNDGSEGVWMVSDTGLGDLSSSVASFDNIYGFYNSFTYGDVSHPYAPSEAWGKVISISNATLTPVFEKNGTLSDGCDAASYNGLNVKGKVVLVLGDVTRCKSGARGLVAQKAGAAGMLIQTTPLGIASLGGNPDFPMGSIENKAGNELVAQYKKNPNAPLTWSKSASNFLIEGGGAPSDFSSFGLDGDLRSKPDLAAPGGNILSTYPLAKGGYALLSGTSMATPYFAGSHALFKQYKNTKLRGDEVRKFFKNTASIHRDTGSKAYTSVVKQGAGLINVYNALTTTSTISPDHIDLLDTKHLQKTVKITLTNSGEKTETYTMSHIPADALNSYPKGNTFPLPTPETEADYASVSFSQSKIQLPAGKSAIITLRFAEPKSGKANQFPLYSGYILATPASKDSVTVHVPYTGLKGDVSKVPMMDTDLKFPSLVALDVTSGNMTDLPQTGVRNFDMNSTMPAILTRLGSHSPSAEIRVYDAANKLAGYVHSANIGNAVGPQGRVKNVDDEGELVFTPWVWNGLVLTSAANITAAPTKLASGTYHIVVASQRKFTKGNYPADYEVFDLGKVKF
ncbi:hypothetical protein BGZ54_006867 [Gamsiella multidivaricata]|nr:hypothetical protein BGZ54_006867 [Gamsiella multidivaricata]